MSAIASQIEALEQEPEDFASVSTTLNDRERKKFPSRPIAVVRSVRSVAQTLAKDLGIEAKSYYLSPHIQSLASAFLPPCPYQLRTIEEQPEELGADDIAVHTLARPISGQNVSFIQASAKVKRGKFFSSLIGCLPADLPQSPSQSRDFEIGEEEPIWRGTFSLPHTTKVLLSKDIEVKVDELPAWKPHIVIDSYRLEDDDE